jgi:hypothetical protein
MMAMAVTWYADLGRCGLSGRIKRIEYAVELFGHFLLESPHEVHRQHGAR